MLLDWLKFAFEISAAAIGAAAAAMAVVWRVRGYIEKGFKKNRKIFYKALKDHDDKNEVRHKDNQRFQNDLSNRLTVLETRYGRRAR